MTGKATDTRLAILTALDYCNDARLIRPGALTAARIAAEQRRMGKPDVADHSEAMLARLCDEAVDIPEDFALSLSEDIESTVHALEPDLVEAAALAYDGRPERADDDAVLLSRLANVIRTTDNLSSFVEAIRLASEKLALTRLLEGYGVAGPPPHPDIVHVASYLAACDIFRDCGPASLLAMRMCFATCSQPMGVQELLRLHSSEIQYREAQALAQRIVALRNG